LHASTSASVAASRSANNPSKWFDSAAALTTR
jgi:hypothetical protein